MKRRLLPSAFLVAAFLAAATASAQTAGVTLYEGVRLTGERAFFARDVFDLNETPFGAKRASSVDVPRGCRVTLFELSGYRGRSLELTDRDDDLGNSRLGRGSVASLRVECEAGSGPGVTLFRDSNLRGPSQTFDADVPDLEQTRFGARRASSIEVPPGCMATLYSETGYRGRSTTFRETDGNLRETPVGNDTAQSMRVDCGQGRQASGGPRPVTRPDAGDTDGVTLFADNDFRGESQAFRHDVPDLARTRIGARTASSIQVPAGCRATLFTEPNYRGRSATLDGEHAALRKTPVGNDTARSMRVDCGQGPRGPRVPRPVTQPDAGDTTGVTLFADNDFRGASQAFRYDVPDLSQTRIGARTASSIQLTPGCRATLFSERGYQGRSETFDTEHGNLRQTKIGNDAAQSMRVECGSRLW